MNANIPNDPIMLLSFINMKLRDIYPSLEALCEDMDIREEELAESSERQALNTTRNRTDSDKQENRP